MATQKITVTVPLDLVAAGRDAAARDGRSFSDLVTAALRRELHADGARAAGAYLGSPDGAELREQLRHAAHRRAATLSETDAA